MANDDTPFGARLTGSLSQATANGQVNPYTVLATDAVALFVGDFVKLSGALAVNEDGLYLPVVAQAAATNTIVGFVVGVKANGNSLDTIYRPASTLATVYVCDDPYAMFEIQTNGTGLVADAGQNADITVGTGSSVTGLSAMEIDQTATGSATAQLRIVRMMQRPDNEVGEFMKWICFINEHAYKSTTGA